MKPIKKQIVTDESMRPVAVLIDYQDWQAIEEILETYQQQDTASALAEYAGVIQLTVDPLAYQQQIRDEWEYFYNTNPIFID
ncbi:hypothetical protein ACN4EK_25015 [Pantanalinema rosaneae CENA516]|uniref:hypothetical protein n=1 Tax=Pantanalinema rosaneae TaxID=1620701 RepID=UPI003D6E1D48